MLSPIRTAYLAASLVLIAVSAQPAAITLNGTCKLGNCASPDALNQGGANGANFSYIYTAGDGDRYSITGAYSASFTAGTSISFTAVANYIGNSTNTASSADTLSVDLLQDYNFTGNPDGTYSATANLIQSGDAPGSYTQAQLSYNGQGLGLMGPYYGPGSQPFSSSKTLSGLTEPLAADFNYTFYFAAGTPAVPEPAEAPLLALGLVALIGPVIRWRRAAGATSYHR